MVWCRPVSSVCARKSKRTLQRAPTSGRWEPRAVQNEPEKSSGPPILTTKTFPIFVTFFAWGLGTGSLQLARPLFALQGHRRHLSCQLPRGQQLRRTNHRRPPHRLPDRPLGPQAAGDRRGRPPRAHHPGPVLHRQLPPLLHPGVLWADGRFHVDHQHGGSGG